MGSDTYTRTDAEAAVAAVSAVVAPASADGTRESTTVALLFAELVPDLLPVVTAAILSERLHLAGYRVVGPDTTEGGTSC